MDALLMCGGRGTRLESAVEKPLFEIDGRPMVDYVRAALAEADLDAVYAVTSPHAPDTRAHLDGAVPVVDADGEGYVADLGAALADERVSTPALTVAADLPLLTADAVETVLGVRDPGASLTVRVPAALKRALGASVDGDGAFVPAGVNVVDDGDRNETYTTYDARFAVNVNRRSDAEVAARLLAVPPSGEVDRGP